MGLFVYFAVPLICTLLFRHFVRQPTGALFLEGLYAYLPQASAIPTPPLGPRTTKRDRKLLQKRQLQLKGAQSSLVMQQLSPSALHHLSSEPTTFGSNFETLGILLLVLFVGVAVHFTLGPLLGLWQDVLLYTLGPMVVLWAIGQLVLLECSGSFTRLLGDRFRLLALATVAATAAFVLLLAAPPGWVRWDVQAAAKDLDELFNGGISRLMAARMRHYKPPEPLVSHPTAVAAGVAVVAGLLAAAMLGPAARVAKLYSYISPVPTWASKYLEPHPLAIGAVRISLALPLVVVLYGIIPMSDFWSPPPALAAVLGPVLVAAAAAAQLLAVRPLAAAHLGGGLLEWHLLRHEVVPGASGTAVSAAVQGGREVVLRKRLTLVYATVCQVGLQLLAPAAIMTCLALLYVFSSGSLDSYRTHEPLLINMGAKPFAVAAPVAPPPPPPPSATSTATPTDILEGMGSTDGFAAAATAAATAAAAAGAVSGGELPALPPLDYIRFVVWFLAWWCCAVNCLFTYPLMFVYRTGLHVG